jgi:hypothetical protein
LLTMEFKTFLSAFIHIPCQIVKHARHGMPDRVLVATVAKRW